MDTEFEPIHNDNRQSNSSIMEQSPNRENLITENSLDHDSPNRTILNSHYDTEENFINENATKNINHNNNNNNKIYGAAFNTTPIYDAQGSLVGLQAPIDNTHHLNTNRHHHHHHIQQSQQQHQSVHLLDEISNNDRNDNLSCIPMQSMYRQYNMMNPQTSNLLSNEYLSYNHSYNLNHNPHLYTLSYQHPQHFYSQTNQHPTHNMQQQQQQTQPNQQAQSQTFVNDYQTQVIKPFLIRTHSGNRLEQTNQYGNYHQHPQHGNLDNCVKIMDSYDKCPTVCSLFAIFCCPITLWCSLPALIYSLCAYTDYKTLNYEQYRQKSDIARHLVITACIIGLLLCIAWAILAFFYYEIMLATFNDIIRVINHRIRTNL